MERFDNIEFSYSKTTNRRAFMKEVHYHNDYELYFLIKGTTKYLIGDEAFQVNKGNFVFVPKGLPHKTDSEECLHNERIVLSFGDDVFDEDMQVVLKELSRDKLICIEKTKLTIVTDILQKLQNEYYKQYEHKDIMIKTYTRELLTLLCRYRTVEKQELSESDRLIYTISEYISTNFSKNLSLNALSHRFAVSEGQLSRKFKEVFGMGLSEYIRYIRILNAERLLKGTKLSITEIAEKCGFNDSNYFSVFFKKAMGTTPGKYRRMSRPDV